MVTFINWHKGNLWPLAMKQKVLWSSGSGWSLAVIGSISCVKEYQWVEKSSLTRDQFFLQKKERLNNHIASNFKGTQVHASTAGDWLIKALFALSGIPIALSQVIEKGKKVFVWVPYLKSTKSNVWLKGTPVTAVFFSLLFNPDINKAYASMLVKHSNELKVCTVSISVVHRISFDRLNAATEQKERLNPEHWHRWETTNS